MSSPFELEDLVLVVVPAAVVDADLLSAWCDEPVVVDEFAMCTLEWASPLLLLPPLLGLLCECECE